MADGHERREAQRHEGDLVDDVDRAVVERDVPHRQVGRAAVGHRVERQRARDDEQDHRQSPSAQAEPDDERQHARVEQRIGDR
jgi:hypothetical protein